MSAFHSQFGSVHPCCSPNESAACFIHAADSSAVQKILPSSEKCETLCQFCLPIWDDSASEWDLQGHRLHLSSQCSDRQIICHTIATAIASSILATYVSAVSELWREASKSVTGQIESDIDSSATRRRESEGRVKLTLSQQSGCCGEKRGKAESPSTVY